MNNRGVWGGVGFGGGTVVWESRAGLGSAGGKVVVVVGSWGEGTGSNSSSYLGSSSVRGSGFAVC